MEAIEQEVINNFPQIRFRRILNRKKMDQFDFAMFLVCISYRCHHQFIVIA